MARSFFVGLLITALTLNTLVGVVKENFVEHNRYVARKATFALFHEKQFLCTATAYEHKGNHYKLLTAGHCDVFSDSRDKYNVQNENLINQKSYPVKILKQKRDMSSHLDYMILDMETTDKFPIVKIGDSKNIHIGDPLFMVHFGEGIGKQQTTGNVATDVMDEASASEDSGQCGLCVERFMATLFGAPGSSGAAVIDERTGKVVGILTGGISGATLGPMIEPINLFKAEL